MSTGAKSAIKGVLRVTGQRYLVDELKQPESKPGGGGKLIITPGTAREDWTKYGRVCAVGDGTYTADGKFHGCSYSLGDTVLFDRYTGRTVVNGFEYRLVPEEHMVALIDPAELGVE